MYRLDLSQAVSNNGSLRGLAVILHYTIKSLNCIELVFHLWLKNKAGQVCEYEGCGDSHSAGSKASHEDSDESLLSDGLFYAFPEKISKSEKGNAGACAGKIHELVIDSH